MVEIVFELVRCRNADDFSYIHEIREIVLFNKQRTQITYNRHHPDDQNPNNHNFLYLQNNKAIGTTRLDFVSPQEAAVRLVAVLPEYQQQGIGTAILKALEFYAKERGITKLMTNSAVDAVEFYRENGFVQQEWDDPGEGSSQPTLQMIKEI